MATLITLHPITHDSQKYIVPANAVVGDNVGAVNYLWSHPYFANEKWGISLTESSYSFEIVGGNADGTFAIDSSTGELTVADTANLSGDKSITVRVKVFDWYYKDTTCNIKVIPTSDCIFFDSSYLGGDSDGTRAKPFLKLNNYGTSTGTAGKTYFYRRAKTYSNDRNEFTNPKVGGSYPDYIRMGAWGQGVRPKIDMTGSAGHFVTIGTIPWGNAAIVEADVCHNFEIYDFETYNDICEDRGHFLVKPAGDNIEGHRLKSANTKYQDGLIYLPTSDAIDGNEANRNCRFIDIETNQTKYRGFKIESEGVTVHNNKGYTDNTLNSLDGVTGTEMPCAQAAHRPNVEIKYMVCICDDISPNNLGLQVRAGYQTYQWCYLEGLANALVVYVHAANDGVGGDYNITSTSGFFDIIIKGALQAGYFGRQGGTTDNPDGVRFERIKLIECEGGFQVAYGAINTLFSYVDASSTKGWGFKVFDHAGAGTRIENSSAMNTFGGSGGIDLDVSGVTVKNTNYSGLSGTIGTGANNSTSSDPAVLEGAGADLGYSTDIQGTPLPALPSIGAYEYAELQYTIHTEATNGTVSGGGVKNDGDDATLTAVANAGYKFKRWEEDSATVSTANPYVFEATEDRELTAVFVRVYENTITVSPPGAGTASESPTGPHENTTEVTLTATPAEGKQFVRWSVEGDLFSTENPHSYFVSGYGFDLVAEFEDVPKWDVILSANPPGGGTVEEITSGPYAEDEDFEIEATPAPGYRFVDWTIYGFYFYDQPYYVGTMGTEDLPLVANFELIPTYTVTMQVTPEGGGTVEEISAGPYETGEAVQLRATAAEGYSFVRWKNGEVEQTTNPEFNFNMGVQNLVLTAEFEESAPVFFSLSVVSSPGLAGSVTGSGEYEAGDKVSLMVTNNTGWTFLYWMLDGEVISETKSFEFTMPAENVTVYAFSELTGSMANARVEPEPEQVPEPLPQPEPQEEEEPEPDVLRGVYKLNNIDLAEQFGFIPRQSGNTNLAISGCWDMPERIGKTFHDWEDQDGIEPYVAGPEIRWSGRDVLLTGLLKGDDQADGLSKLYDLYAHISALDSVALLECELGSWNVMVNGEVKAEHISEGWYLVDIPFRQPVVYINAPVVEPSDLGNELGIDSRSFADLGFIFLRLEQSYNRPAPKGLVITSFPYESERVNKIEAREIKLQGVFLSPDYNTFKNRLNGLYSLLAQPGLRSIIVDGQVLHRVFVKDGVQVQDVRITGDGQVTAVITINFTEGEPSVINWDYLADAEGNIILNDEGNKLLIIPDDAEVVMDQFLADGFGQLILTKEGEKIVIKK